jgi:hypothetical protein
VLLVFALDGCILAAAFGDDVDAHIWALESKSSKHSVWDIFQSPDVVVATNMLEVEDAEFLEDVPTDLLVVTTAHIGERMCGALVPGLTLLDELVEERGPDGGTAKEDGVKLRVHCGMTRLYTALHGSVL